MLYALRVYDVFSITCYAPRQKGEHCVLCGICGGMGLLLSELMNDDEMALVCEMC